MPNFRTYSLQLAVSAGLLLGAAPASIFAQDSTPADNTKVNKDARKGAPTADNQKMNKSDREITKEIRRAVVADKSLSTYAHNVKIISQHGAVTLKGPVRSDAEKSTIEQKATEVAGSGKVTNEITIAPGKSGK